MTANPSTPARCLSRSNNLRIETELPPSRNHSLPLAPELGTSRPSWSDLTGKDPAADEMEPPLPMPAESHAREASPVESHSRPVDDPLRVYLQQMGPLPLLSRNEEIEICRRIEV